jgi:uncharacterized protein
MMRDAQSEAVLLFLKGGHVMELKLSQFTLSVHDYPEVGRHLLYNTLTRAVAKVDDEGWEVLQNLPHLPDGEDVREWLTVLAKNGFIVACEADEGTLYIQRLDKARDNTAYFHVTLSLIQKCNLGCGYCYQGGKQSTHDASRITDEAVEGAIQTEKIIAFLQSQCEERRVKQFHFTAYGGEPLLNKAALIAIVSVMHAYCQQKGVKWTFSMVSNGSLLNRKTVLELKKYGFSQVQITIDGNKETHDISRPWRSERGKGVSTYDTIMRNLESWAGLIHTDVLCVVSQANILAAHELIDTLADKGLAAKRVRMKFSPVSPTYDNETIEEISSSFAEHPELVSTELEIVDAITKLQIHAAQRGLIDDLRPQGAWCAVIRANGQNIAVTPDGKIYSCALFFGRDNKYATGHIDAPERGGLDEAMQVFRYPETCRKCAYLPICSNCRADALAKTGDILGTNSYKARYDRMMPQLIKAHYDLGRQPGR